ncbi:MAG: sugar phosphate isomerase/epimerase [Chloroflexi bacterium]|nr:sugar phosphate isomerase/epimerase [Chloroflexota bacterium]
MQIVMFTKMLRSLPIDQAGDIIAELGFEGVDLACRGEHVRPENVAEELPQAQEILAKRNLPIAMLTTDVTDATQPYAEAIFKTAAHCGVRFLKLGYWRYAGFGHLREQIARVRQQLEGIQSLALQYGVKACIHNHSGDILSAVPATVAMLLKGFDKRALGAYVDPGHLTVEGGLGGWKQGIDILSEYASLVAVKSFGWFPETDLATGEKRWRAKLVPLSEGTAHFAEAFAMLRQAGFDGVVSVASEYHGWSLPQIVEQTRVDLAYLKGLLGR